MDANHTPNSQPHTLYTVKQAADILGITVEAVRARINRGTLERVDGQDGRVFVRLDPNHTQPYADHTQDHTVEESVVYRLQRDQIDLLKSQLERKDRELERKDAILLNMTEAMKALQPPPEPRESDLATSESPTSAQAPDDTAGEPRAERSWWQRWFGG